MVMYPWQRTKNMETGVFGDNFGSTDSNLPTLHRPSFSPHLPTVLPAKIFSLTFSVAATFCYTKQQDDIKNKKQTLNLWGGRRDELLSTSVQRTQCLRQHAEQTRTGHMGGGWSGHMTDSSPCGRNSAEPHGD